MYEILQNWLGVIYQYGVKVGVYPATHKVNQHGLTNNNIDINCYPYSESSVSNI